MPGSHLRWLTQWMNQRIMQHETGFGLGTNEVKRRHILPKALVVGAVAGLIASAFRVALASTEAGRVAFLSKYELGIRLPLAIGLGALGGAVALWLVRRFAPDAGGSGIPQLKAFVLGERDMGWRRLLPVKFVAGVLGIGSGFALGREGPTIQMGGATGLMVSEWFRVKAGEGERKALIAAGAGAGLAAAFNAPLAGVMFVLEELAGNFTPVIFVAAFLASVTADVVGRLLTGEMPVFPLHAMPAPNLHVLPASLLLGAICGVGGVIFNRSLLKSLDLYARLRWPSFSRQSMSRPLCHPSRVGRSWVLLVASAPSGQCRGAMKWPCCCSNSRTRMPRMPRSASVSRSPGGTVPRSSPMMMARARSASRQTSRSRSWMG